MNWESYKQGCSYDMRIDVDCELGEHGLAERTGTLPVSLWIYVKEWKQFKSDPEAALPSVSL
jgi:hypothetical protein